jgi:enolase
MAFIRSIKAREILDSRGNPTVEVDLATDKGLFRAAVPSGASTGIYEALESRDKDQARYKGKGVLTAVKNVNDIIAPKLLGKSVLEQTELDKMMYEELDGSQNEWGWSKEKLGANAILAVSMAVCRASAACKNITLYQRIAELAGKPTDKYVLPIPSMNVINGGSHAGNQLACQEFMVMPIGASSFREAIQMGAEVYHELKGVIKAKYGQDAINVGDEGGFAPSVTENDEALEVLMQAIEKSGHKDRISIATDVAASEFYVAEEKKYDLYSKSEEKKGKHLMTSQELSDYYKNWFDKYPFVSIEDPFDQDDWDAYRDFTAVYGEKMQVVGDDLLVTNPKRIGKAFEGSPACNALLVKVNQIGSVSEALQACKMCQDNGWGLMVSHRSGETEDVFIADLSVGLRAGQIKTGAPCRSERNAKYNQLMRIEEELGDRAVYAGRNFRKPGNA